MIKFLFYILPFLFLLLPSLWVNYILRKNNKIMSDMPFTGKEFGRKILEDYKLYNVTINPIKQIDHYNPFEKKIHISNDKLNKKSITSISVVAHEIGHAIQDRDNYKPLKLRQTLIEKTLIFQKLGSFLLLNLASPTSVYILKDSYPIIQWDLKNTSQVLQGFELKPFHQ